MSVNLRAWKTQLTSNWSVCGEIEARTQAGQGVDTVNVHGAGTADTLTAGTAEGQGRVELVLDADEGIQHHGTGLVEIELVALHGRLLGRGVRVPAVDLEGLHVGVVGGNRVDRLGLNGRIGASEAGGPEQRPRRSEEAGGGAEGGHGGRMERRLKIQVPPVGELVEAEDIKARRKIATREEVRGSR